MWKKWIVVAGALALAGCFDMQSVQPLWTDETAIQAPLLTGVWQTDMAKEQLIVVKAGERKYRAVYLDEDGKATSYDVRVGKMEGVTIADLLPLQDCVAIPGHAFARIAIDEKSLKLQFLDSERLRAKAVEEKLGVRTGKEQAALTASTAALYSFLRRNLAAEEKTDWDAAFKRVKE